MNKYTEISKRLGFEPCKAPNFPSVAEAQNLHNRVMINQDAEAFERVFYLYRFCASPDGGEDAIAMEIIWKTFNDGSRFFK